MGQSGGTLLREAKICRGQSEENHGPGIELGCEAEQARGSLSRQAVKSIGERGNSHLIPTSRLALD